MLRHGSDFEQVIDFRGSYSVFECEYYPGKFLYVAQPTRCGEDDGWNDICDGLSSDAAIAMRDEKRLQEYGSQLAVSL